jgi:hypothetical protein
VLVLNRPDEEATQKLRELGTLLGKLAVAE